jgi:uncharacterized protein YuzE
MDAINALKGIQDVVPGMFVQTMGSLRLNPSYNLELLSVDWEAPMIDMTYDPAADAAYIHLSRGCKIESTDEVGPFICDFDSGRVIGIEILDASKVLAPGDWRTGAQLLGP